MTFYSILYKKNENIEGRTGSKAAMPSFFTDLNLDQIIDAITYGKEEYDLKPFFYTHPHDKDEIMYRQEIMKDIENAVLFSYLQSFAENMLAIRQQLVEVKNADYKYEKERLFLDAVEFYGEAIHSLSNNLRHVNLISEGLIAFQNYLSDYIQSESFISLFNETKKILTDLSSVKYCVLTKDLRVEVHPYKSERDYTADIEHTFEKFKQDAVKDYRLSVFSFADESCRGSHIGRSGPIVS
jgi:DNA mismatch repair protein MutS